ncbi:CRISPR-associated endonuclease Cas3'' [Deinococcus caeni]|uniref:CRISPR-associated endonuclease Cas3'' n=1 Tax=Deinococcus caeni TaxID=569127 RepID=UPI00361BBC34
MTAPHMTPHTPSAAVQVLWAKSGQLSAGTGWLPVLHHLLDVGACAAAILEREPASTRDLLAGDLGVPDTDLAVRWICALAALHDLGKASPAFQHKADVLAARVWKVLPWQNHSESTPHGLVTQKILPPAGSARLELGCGAPRRAGHRLPPRPAAGHAPRPRPGHRN